MRLGRIGGLVPGDCADIVQFRIMDGRIEIVSLWISRCPVSPGRQ